MNALVGALVVSVPIAACADGAPTTDPPPLVVTELALGGEATLVAPDGEPGICELLPLDGPCSLVCDPAALIARYVPAGSCVTFFCELTDGRTIIVDVCHIDP